MVRRVKYLPLKDGRCSVGTYGDLFQGTPRALYPARCWERRLRLLMMVTVGYAFLLSLLAESMTGLRGWLLHRWCHRTGTRLKTIAMPLYRLRAALSHLWVDVKLPSRISLQNSG